MRALCSTIYESNLVSRGSNPLIAKCLSYMVEQIAHAQFARDRVIGCVRVVLKEQSSCRPGVKQRSNQVVGGGFARRQTGNTVTLKDNQIGGRFVCRVRRVRATTGRHGREENARGIT